MKTRHQWVNWKFETVANGKMATKVPYQPSGALARSNDSATWSSFEICTEALNGGVFDGIGFVFAEGDGLFGIDLDHCYDTNGQLFPWAQEIADRCSDTYIEYSPSKNGLHIWGLGRPTLTGTKKWTTPGIDSKQGIEIYDYRSPRYFTVTGDAISGKDITEAQAALDWLYQEYWIDHHEEPQQARTPDGEVNAELVRNALGFIPADNYPTWIDVGMALHAGGLDCEVWEEWSRTSNKYEPGACETKWDTFQPTRIGLGSVFYLAKQHGFKFPIKTRSLDDIGNAERFVALHGDKVRWFGAAKKWLIWEGTRWVFDDRDRITKLAKQTARVIYEKQLPATRMIGAKKLHNGRTTVPFRTGWKGC